MFGNTIIHKRMMKKEALLQALEKAKEKGSDWEIKQAESKLALLERKNYPKTIWDSPKGTYKKTKENKEI